MKICPLCEKPIDDLKHPIVHIPHKGLRFWPVHTVCLGDYQIDHPQLSGPWFANNILIDLRPWQGWLVTASSLVFVPVIWWFEIQDYQQMIADSAPAFSLQFQVVTLMILGAATLALLWFLGYLLYWRIKLD